MTEVFNWIQLDTFSFSSNFLNMFQGGRGGGSEGPATGRKSYGKGSGRCPYPQTDGTTGRSQPLSLTGRRHRQLRFTAPRNVTTSAPPTRVGALRVPRITDSASVAVAERAGLGQEEVVTRSFPAGGRMQGRTRRISDWTQADWLPDTFTSRVASYTGP